MTEFERDPIIDRVRDTLRGAPKATPDQRAVARVLQTVWESPRPSAWQRWLGAWRLPAVSALGAGAVAVAALALGFVSRGAVSPKGDAAQMAAAGAPTGEYPVAQPAAYDAELARVPTQFVFENAGAAQVALVGDFNEWKEDATPLVKLPNGLWTTTVPLSPGRHVYAFLVDGTLLVADPRAPKAGDEDYGREGSVVMVFDR